MAKKASGRPNPKKVSLTAGTSKPTEAHFSDDFLDRRMLFNFLEASYNGGIRYKDSYDAFGFPVLIEHENEYPGGGMNTQSLFHRAIQSGHSDADQLKSNRFFRRKRIASYENHVKPIVDKFVSYAIRNPPNRHKKIQAEIERLQLDQFMEDLLCEGLKFTEYWIGWDASGNISADEVLTQAEAEQRDPINKGKPYLVMMDPRLVVDFDTDPNDDDVITRVVFQEIQVVKNGFTSKPTKVVQFKEWTKDYWRIYKCVDNNGSNDNMTNVKVIAGPENRHAFGRCPWIRFRPPFPIEDIAELNRALFNMCSLLDEELYQCTFTQKWITGEKPEALKNTQSGTGNTLVIPNPEANVGVFGAVPGQAQALMDRVNHLRDSIYIIVSMENTSNKNVAEAAEKKKRDLEALYTMLLQIVKCLEDTENRLLLGMEIISDINMQTNYDRKFDVNSIAELQEELDRLTTLPMVPPTLKRELASQLAQKLDPFGDQEQYRDEIQKLIVSDEAFLRGLEILKTSGMYTVDILMTLLGVPEDQRKDFEAKMNLHDTPENPPIGDPMQGNEEGDTDTPDEVDMEEETQVNDDESA